MKPEPLKTDTVKNDSYIVMLKDVKKGTYFRYGKKIYIRDEYERSSKKYLCMPVDDVWGTGKLIDGNKLVDIGIEY